MEEVIDLASSPPPFKRWRTTSPRLEVIDLDSPVARKPSPQHSRESDSEVEIVEAAPSSSRKRPAKRKTPFPADRATPGEEGQWVGRIREVFPLINRRRAHELVQMARGFARGGRGEEIVVSVMQVLSADPTGAGITSKSFAVNAVGGSLEGPHGPPTSHDGKVTELECPQMLRTSISAR